MVFAIGAGALVGGLALVLSNARREEKRAEGPAPAAGPTPSEIDLELKRLGIAAPEQLVRGEDGLYRTIIEARGEPAPVPAE